VKVVPAVTASITVVELLAKFLEFAQLQFGGPDGKPTSDLSNWKILLRRLRTFAGRLTVTEFGPLRLREFRETLIAEGLARTMINNRINMVRRIFSWGVNWSRQACSKHCERWKPSSTAKPPPRNRRQ
jgi:hypothetical protein